MASMRRREERNGLPVYDTRNINSNRCSMPDGLEADWVCSGLYEDPAKSFASSSGSVGMLSYGVCGRSGAAKVF